MNDQTIDWIGIERLCHADGGEVPHSEALIEMFKAAQEGWAPTGDGASIEWMRCASSEWIDHVTDLFEMWNSDDDDGKTDGILFGVLIFMRAWETKSGSLSFTVEEVDSWMNAFYAAYGLEVNRREGLLEYELPSVFCSGDSDLKVRYTAKGQGFADRFAPFFRGCSDEGIGFDETVKILQSALEGNESDVDRVNSIAQKHQDAATK